MDNDGIALHLGLLKNDQYPEGQFVPIDKNVNIKFTFQSIGAASAAQIIIYHNARNDGLKHIEAPIMANSREDLQVVLDNTTKLALADGAENESGTRYHYESAEVENTVIYWAEVALMHFLFFQNLI